eukprot:CAMPEP_0172391142 /NCGR_PEP_ID=MMETSP1061-20121228/7611_1 /TAXON_ID=37318 /ORGANISM="Pseudo-nitzschia pungens, Strain cf. pungens" /LENGTH=338 /DNA_ID=CAMNT_0013121681 /DNA_START=175 /DNA_END=1191 /DNA_ORIENTATION=+
MRKILQPHPQPEAPSLPAVAQPAPNQPEKCRSATATAAATAAAATTTQMQSQTQQQSAAEREAKLKAEARAYALSGTTREGKQHRSSSSSLSNNGSSGSKRKARTAPLSLPSRSKVLVRPHPGAKAAKSAKSSSSAAAAATTSRWFPGHENPLRNPIRQYHWAYDTRYRFCPAGHHGLGRELHRLVYLHSININNNNNNNNNNAQVVFWGESGRMKVHKALDLMRRYPTAHIVHCRWGIDVESFMTPFVEHLEAQLSNAEEGDDQNDKKEENDVPNTPGTTWWKGRFTFGALPLHVWEFIDEDTGTIFIEKSDLEWRELDLSQLDFGSSSSSSSGVDA